MTLLHDLLDSTAARNPTNPAIRHQGRDYSYEEVRDRSLRAAACLRESGVVRGDRVAVFMTNRPEIVDIAFACSRIGAMFVPINPLLKSRQLGHVLRDCGAHSLVSSVSALASVEEELQTISDLRRIVVGDGAVSRLPRDAIRYEQLLAFPPVVNAARSIDNDPAAILYTSSSSGLAKGVVVSHRNLVSGARSVTSYLGNRGDDRILVALHLSFDYGLSQVTTAFFVGACAVLTQYLTASALLRELGNEAITGLAGVPTMWAQLAAVEWPPEAAATLRYITNSGGTISPATLVRLTQRLPQARIFSMYGLTEAFRSTYLDPSELSRRPDSIGKAIPDQEVLVLRADGGLCEDGEVGELVHRGSLVTLGYWNAPEATQAVFRPLPGRARGIVDEIAVWSGDMVARDSAGFLYFRGRRDQQIKTAGYRVSPTEVEKVAMEVDGLLDAVAVGLPDEMLGQRIVLAVVIGDRDAEEVAESVRQHCRQHLPAFMTPSQVVVLPHIPATPNGKHDRGALRTVLQEQPATASIDADAPHSTRARQTSARGGY